MIPETFTALRAEEDSTGQVIPAVKQISFSDLPENGILIKVHYTSLNYKDALSATGHRGVTRKYPHTPGIDACGTVVYSANPAFKKGDEVLACAYDLGMNTSGGFGQYIRVPSEWVMPLPEGMSFRESMMLGTAGFTAALALHQMETMGQNPAMGPVLVTGAGGGLGSLAVNLLSQLGYDVIAASGKTDENEYFSELGAHKIIDRSKADDQSGKPLLRPMWAGVIDSVGGSILSTAIKSCFKHGNVAVCGNALSPEFNINVFPFILNGVNLLGIESATCPMPIRKLVWQKLAGEWKPAKLELISKEITLNELPEYIHLILKGKIRGRVYVNMED